MAKRITDESLADAERYCREGMIERPLLALRPHLGANMSEALLAVVAELRERRAADLTAEDVRVLRWTHAMLKGETLLPPAERSAAIAIIDRLTKEPRHG